MTTRPSSPGLRRKASSDASPCSSACDRPGGAGQDNSSASFNLDRFTTYGVTFTSSTITRTFIASASSNPLATPDSDTHSRETGAHKAIPSTSSKFDLPSKETCNSTALRPVATSSSAGPIKQGKAEPSLSHFPREAPQDVDAELSAILDGVSTHHVTPATDRLVAYANRSANERDGRSLIRVANVIVEKAMDDMGRSELYAQLCHGISERIDPGIRASGVKAANGKRCAGGQLFRKFLLNRCQDEFERGVDEDNTSFAEIATRRQRYLGLVKFLGELFKVKLLTERIIQQTIQTFLGNIESPRDFHIDGLHTILTTVGHLLDTEEGREHLDVYFQHIKELSESNAVSPRLRLMLQSLIELRREQWYDKLEAPSCTWDDEGSSGHILGELNAPWAKMRAESGPIVVTLADDSRYSPTSASDDAVESPLESTPLSATNAGVEHVEDLSPNLSLCKPRAEIGVEENVSEFFSLRGLVEAERYFSDLPTEYHHLQIHRFVASTLRLEKADAYLVAALFAHTVARNICSPASFEEGFTPTAKHIGDIASSAPKAFEVFAIMFKGARLDEDFGRWTRILNESTASDELIVHIFGCPASALPQTLPRVAPAVANLAASRVVPGPSNEPSGRVSTVTQQSPPTTDCEDAHVCGEAPLLHTDAPPIRLPSQSPPLERAGSHEVAAGGVEETLASPISHPFPVSDHTPPIPRRMSQKEANERIDTSVEMLLGGLHDIDKALTIFTDLPPGYHSRLVDRIVSSAIELTQTEAQLVAYFFYCAAAKDLCSVAAFEGGFSLIASALEDIRIDHRKALLLFVTMAKGAGLHKKSDWCNRCMNALELQGDGLR